MTAPTQPVSPAVDWGTPSAAGSPLAGSLAPCASAAGEVAARRAGTQFPCRRIAGSTSSDPRHPGRGWGGALAARPRGAAPGRRARPLGPGAHVDHEHRVLSFPRGQGPCPLLIPKARVPQNAGTMGYAWSLRAVSYPEATGGWGGGTGFCPVWLRGAPAASGCGRGQGWLRPTQGCSGDRRASPGRGCCASEPPPALHRPPPHSPCDVT